MQTIYVNKNTSIDTIQKAIDLVTDTATIHIAKGTYYEKIKLTKSNITFIGEGPLNTIIYFDDYAKKIHKDGLEFNTFRTYSFMILASNISLSNLTIANTSGYGDTIGQAVALHIIGDNIHLDNVHLKAYQDTLFIGPLPHNLITRYDGFLKDDERIIPTSYKSYFNNCYIEGTVDYVFGCGEAYFDNCIFHNLLEGGFVFAPSTYLEDEFGFTVLNSIFTSEVSIPSTYLARPWRDFGKVVLLNCTYQNHILDTGFDKWNDTSRDKTCRFSEYNCNYFDNHSYTRCYFSKVLTAEEAKKYLHKF